jgi:outer membrane biosynthesis protein TonB
MRITLEIDSYTSEQELLELGNLCYSLAKVREAGGNPYLIPSLATQPPELDIPAQPEPEVAPDTTPKRTRKPKNEPAATTAAEPAPATEPVVDTVAVPEVAQQPEPAAEPAAVPAPVAPSGNTYTEAEVQKLATLTARTKGPDVVKSKIAELGAARIAELNEAQLAILGDYLTSLQ